MRRLALPFALAAAVAACGDDPGPATGPLRVQIVVASGDGAAPSPIALRSEDGKTTLALQPSKDGAGNLEAAGPAGKWFVVPPEGWAVVGTKAALSLQPGLGATPVPLGRRHSIYLVAPTGVKIGDVVVGRESDGSVLANVQRLSGEDGRVVLRLPPSEWHDAVVVTTVLGEAVISAPARLPLPADGHPVGVGLRSGATASLDVRLFRPGDGGPVVGVEVAASGGNGQLQTRAYARTDADGIARFGALPAVVPALDVRAGTAVMDLTSAQWRLTGEVRLAIAPPEGAAFVALSVANVAAGTQPQVQVRAERSTSYAVVSGAWGAAGEVELRLPPGADYRLYATSGDRGGFVDVPSLEAVAPSVAHVKATLALQPLSTLRLKVPPPRGDRHRVRVLCRRQEGDRQVLAQGWSVVANTPDLVDVPLPVGTYKISILDGDREGPSVTWTFEKPGSQGQIDLTPP